MIYLDAIEGGRVEERLHEEGVGVTRLQFVDELSDVEIGVVL